MVELFEGVLGVLVEFDLQVMLGRRRWVPLRLIRRRLSSVG